MYNMYKVLHGKDSTMSTYVDNSGSTLFSTVLRIGVHIGYLLQ